MINYVVLSTFTDQGIRNAKDTVKRMEAFKEMAKKFGVTVKETFWTQGTSLRSSRRRMNFLAQRST